MVASNPESSRLTGINTGVILMLGWGLSPPSGPWPARWSPPGRGSFDSTTMQIVLVYAFAAAALGGFESLMGAVVAGLIVGVSQTLTIQYIDALDGIDLVVLLGLILIVLLVKPNGLFGRKTVEAQMPAAPVDTEGASPVEPERPAAAAIPTACRCPARSSSPGSCSGSCWRSSPCTRPSTSSPSPTS